MIFRNQNTDSSSQISRTALAAKNQLPPEEASALENIHASVDFLLKALAEDLDAPVPSKEPAFLQVANDRLCLVRSLIERLESTREFLAKFDKTFGASGQITP